MGDVRPPMTEETIRETKDGLVKDIQADRERVGVPVPDVRTTEEFLDPILREAEAKHAEERRKDPTRPPPPPHRRKWEPTADEVGEAKEKSEWYGEPEHSPKMAEIPGTTGQFTCQQLGQLAWNTKTDEVLVGPDIANALRGPKMTRTERIVKQRLQTLMQYPEWKDKLVKALMANIKPEERRAAYLQIIKDSYRTPLGNPFKPREPKIYVG